MLQARFQARFQALRHVLRLLPRQGAARGGVHEPLRQGRAGAEGQGVLPGAAQERVRLLPREGAHAEPLPEAQGARPAPAQGEDGGDEARQGGGGLQSGADAGAPPDAVPELLRRARHADPAARAAAPREGAPPPAPGRAGAEHDELPRDGVQGVRRGGGDHRPQGAARQDAGAARRGAVRRRADDGADRRGRGVLQQRPRRRGRRRGARRAPPRGGGGRGWNRAPGGVRPRRRLRRVAHGRRLGRRRGLSSPCQIL